MRFASSESTAGLGGLLRALPCRWVNHPGSLISADYKPIQLKTAADHNLCIPSTVITNDRTSLLDFVDRCEGDVIYKTMSGGVLPLEGQTLDSRAVFTSRLDSIQRNELDRVRNCACMFQKVVPRQYDLRVTVFGSELFAVEIHYVQDDDDDTVIDWRAHHGSLRYQEHDLPAKVGEKVVSVVKALGLVFGAVDMIVTPTGEYVFLEVNPSGQWMWLEMELELGMTASMARLLADAR